MTEAPTIVAAICTYRRNEPLRTLMKALMACADELGDRARVGVVISDDNTDRRAEAVAAEFADRFEAGVRYCYSGRGNISSNRNTALEAALETADWVAMTDDDCEPPRHWLSTMLELAEQTGADCTTGQMRLRAPAGAPDWLTDEPFLEAGMIDFVDGQRVHLAGTNNSMTSAAWLRAHPDIRFDERMGVIGGEDMVFFRSAEKAGLHIRYSERGYVHGNEPAERATLTHQLRSHFWLGNTECITNLELGDVSRPRAFVRGARRSLRALRRPVTRMLRGQRPQLRYTLATTLHGIGLMLGSVGLRVRHH